MINTRNKKLSIRKNDRGSVLIFVVGILVLLALSATAYLATARSDRVASKQYESNTQIDMLMDACIEIAKNAMLTDPAVNPRIADYVNVTASSSNPFVASRVPTKFDPMPTTAFGAANPAVWMSITAPLLGETYEAPTGQIVPKLKYGELPLVPYGVTFNGVTQPVMSYDTDPATAGFTNVNSSDLTLSYNIAGPTFPYLFAGDADGDGIADSLPVKLPVGQVNGVTYYVYYRIIDNGSAINVNSAMSRDSDFAATPGSAQLLPDGEALYNRGYFTSNVGLVEMLRDYPWNASQSSAWLTTTYAANRSYFDLGQSFHNFMRFHFNSANPYAAGALPAAPAPTGLWAGAAQTTWPYDDANVMRDDFAWYSIGDYFDRQITQRTANPGWLTPGVKPQSFTINDAISLADRFTLIQPDISIKSDVEKALDTSVYNVIVGGVNYMKSLPYATTDAQGIWFSQLFNYDAEYPITAASPRFPVRSLLTASGDIRNIVPTKYAVTYDSVYLDYAGAFTAVTGKNVPAYIPPTNNEYPVVNAEPAVVGGIYPGGMSEFPKGGSAKVSILTAPFSELYRAFWQVFATSAFTSAMDDGGTIFGTINTAVTTQFAANGPYKETNFDSNTNAAIARGPAAGAGQKWPSMFRSPIRSVADVRTGSSTGGESALTYATYGVRMPADQVALLRAALAAQNLDSMRYANHPVVAGAESPDKVHYRDIALKVVMPPNPPTNNNPYAANVRVRVFGHGRQPFISEVYASSDTTANAASGGTNPNGYIAIEFYNPYDVDIDISNCRIGILHRNSNTAVAGELPSMPLTDATTLDQPIDLTPLAPLIVPRKGFLVVDNFDPSLNDASAAVYIPISAGLRSPDAVFVPNLHQLFNREFVLMRPMDATLAAGGGAGGADLLTYTNPAGAPSITVNFMPLDSYDLTGITLLNSPEDVIANPINVLNAWHYQRETEDLTFGTDYWRFVYPGRYDGSKAEHAPGYKYQPRQMGTAYARTELEPDAPGWLPSPGAPNGFERENWPDSHGVATSGVRDIPDPAPSFGLPNSNVRHGGLFSIQLLNHDWPGKHGKQVSPNPGDPNNTNVYPFGQFAKLGDMMQVPYIGSYIIFSPIPSTVPGVTPVLEVNPITMDAAMAEDGDIDDDPVGTDNGTQAREQIGRFAPLRPTADATGVYSPTDTPATTAGYSDYSENPDHWRYQFATRLFDFFCLNSPADDYLPNVKSHLVAAQSSENSYHYFDAAGARVNLRFPYPIANDFVGASSHIQGNATTGLTSDDMNEQTLPVRGQININTASMKVLSMLPWLPAGDFYAFDLAAPGYLRLRAPGDPVVEDNVDVARALVYWRDGNLAVAPPLDAKKEFKSIFDLYRADPIRVLQNSLLTDYVPGDTTNAGNNAMFKAEQLDESPSLDGTGAPLVMGDGVRYDFEEQYLLMNRVSNLITTRSDAFTVYILLEGWKNVGTANPERVSQRRASFIYDRSRYDAGNSATPIPLMIPSN